MKTLLFFLNILGIAIASPIQRSEILPGRGYGGNINSISADKGDLKNSSAHENGNRQNGNDGHQEGEIFLNLTTKGYVIADEVSAADAVGLQEVYQHETESLLLHSDASLVQGKGNSQHSTQESMGTYATFPIRKAVNDPHTDLITKSKNIEQNGPEQLRERNAVHGPVSTAEASVAQEAEIFSDKQQLGGFQATNGFLAKKNVDALYREHYHSFGNYHFSDEGMRGDDPGYADVSDSSQPEEDQSDSNDQLGEPDSPSSSNEGSKQSSTSKDGGSPNYSSGSNDANSPNDSSSASESSYSSSSTGSSDSSSSTDSSSASESSDSSSSINPNDSSSSSDSSSSNDSNHSDSSSLSDSSDSSASSDSSNSSESTTFSASYHSNDNSSSKWIW